MTLGGYFADKEERDQFLRFCAEVFYEQPRIKLCTTKILFGQEYQFKMTLHRRQAGLQDRHKNEGHYAIWLTFMICSVKQLNAASVNCSKRTIFCYLVNCILWRCRINQLLN